jgi:hypothetical protein
MNTAIKLAVPLAALILILALLLVPFVSCQRTVMAPDLSHFDLSTYFTAQLSYLPVTQKSQSSLAYLWFGLGASPYNSTYDCSNSQFYCNYVPGPVYPDVFMAQSGSPTDPKASITHVHLSLNSSGLTSVVVSLMLTNDGSVARAAYVQINDSTAPPLQTPVVQPGSSSNCTFTIYPPYIPKTGDHYSLKVMVSGGYLWFKYVQVEG